MDQDFAMDGLRGPRFTRASPAPGTLARRLPDEPDSAGEARELAEHLRGESELRVDDVRLLLHELVAATLHEGVGHVDVEVSVEDGCLRLQATTPVPRHSRGDHRLTPAAELGRRLIDDLSDRAGDDGTTLWCELDGAWVLDPAAAPAAALR